MLMEREQMLQSHFWQSVLWSHLGWHKSWCLFSTQLSQCRIEAKAERDHLSRPLDKPGFLFIVSPTTQISARLLTSHLNNLKNNTSQSTEQCGDFIFALDGRWRQRQLSKANRFSTWYMVKQCGRYALGWCQNKSSPIYPCKLYARNYRIIHPNILILFAVVPVHQSIHLHATQHNIEISWGEISI